MKKILITGGAGFIGYFLIQKLLALGLEVVGIGDLNDYYDLALKQARLDQLSAEPKYSFIKLDLADRTGMERLFIDQQFDIVVNMAVKKLLFLGSNCIYPKHCPQPMKEAYLLTGEWKKRTVPMRLPRYKKLSCAARHAEKIP
jgi:UDP-glucose 4-epimerase